MTNAIVDQEYRFFKLDKIHYSTLTLIFRTNAFASNGRRKQLVTVTGLSEVPF
jgi:hypothetical protein